MPKPPQCEPLHGRGAKVRGGLKKILFFIPPEGMLTADTPYIALSNSGSLICHGVPDLDFPPGSVTDIVNGSGDNSMFVDTARGERYSIHDVHRIGMPILYGPTIVDSIISNGIEFSVRDRDRDRFLHVYKRELIDQELELIDGEQLLHVSSNSNYDGVIITNKRVIPFSSILTPRAGFVGQEEDDNMIQLGDYPCVKELDFVVNSGSEEELKAWRSLAQVELTPALSLIPVGVGNEIRLGVIVGEPGGSERFGGYYILSPGADPEAFDPEVYWEDTFNERVAKEFLLKITKGILLEKSEAVLPQDDIGRIKIISAITEVKKHLYRYHDLFLTSIEDINTENISIMSPALKKWQEVSFVDMLQEFENVIVAINRALLGFEKEANSFFLINPNYYSKMGTIHEEAKNLKEKLLNIKSVAAAIRENRTAGVEGVGGFSVRADGSVIACGVGDNGGLRVVLIKQDSASASGYLCTNIDGDSIDPAQCAKWVPKLARKLFPRPKAASAPTMQDVAAFQPATATATPVLPRRAPADPHSAAPIAASAPVSRTRPYSFPPSL